IKVATPYFKPKKNETNRKPDFYVHETEKWLVFPHELEGLSLQEIIDSKPELGDLIKQIKPFLSK
ncbi:MAG: hypoxanthine phosphoribosyltransferase, partial [Gammaproteobacteria bacterium]|nr:hypoxanthine phosphoribosyltransferase [Gammaproteobacteria bacterium]